MRSEWTRRAVVALAAGTMALGVGCMHQPSNPAPGTGGSGPESTPKGPPNAPTLDQGQMGGVNTPAPQNPDSHR